MTLDERTPRKRNNWTRTVVCQMVVPIRAMRLDETDEETIQRVRNLFIERVTTMAELVGRFDCFMPDELNEDDEG